MSETYQRFSLKQRIEHFSVMSLFTLLVITGMPQKFFEAGWARFAVDAMGGVAGARAVHRIAGLAFAVAVVVHLGTLVIQAMRKRLPVSMVPTRQDFKDAADTLRYYLGLSKHHPKYDRFDYRQKFEYWGLVMGALIMVATGFVLYLPTLAAAYLPGQVIPAAKVAHSNEGLMAMLVVVVWHIYNAHFNPDVFPFDKTIFTGKISRERMEHEHPLELERLEGSGAKGEPKKS